MPRTAVARSPRHDDETTMTHVDELIQRGRGQGHLSLPELRAAFGQAGIAATEAKSILRELSEAGVRLGNDPDGAAARRRRSRGRGSRSGRGGGIGHRGGAAGAAPERGSRG